MSSFLFLMGCSDMANYEYFFREELYGWDDKTRGTSARKKEIQKTLRRDELSRRDAVRGVFGNDGKWRRLMDAEN